MLLSTIINVGRSQLVEGFTATESNMIQIADFLKQSGYKKFEVLPYNNGGITKRIMIGDTIPRNIPYAIMGIKEEEKYREIFRSRLGL